MRMDHGPNPTEVCKQSTLRLTPKKRGYLASAVTDGQWSQSRKCEQGMAVDDSCLLCGEVGTLPHRHCGSCAGWPPELKLPDKMRELAARSDMLEVRCLLERVLWAAPTGIVKPAPSPHVCWLGESDGFFPSGELYLDGSQYEGDFEQYASVAWAVIALEADADAFLCGASGMLCEPHVDINGGELMALLMVLRFAVPPVTVVVDSGFVHRGLLELGPRRTTAHGAAWAHLWREVWAKLEDFGGLGDGGLKVRKVPAHQTQRAMVAHGKISYRDWLGNSMADKAAKSAAAAGRIRHQDRRRLVMANKLVEGVALWVSAVGGALDGRDTTHRVAKPQRPAPKALLAQPAARLSCAWRGEPGKRWCSRCRWVERSGECPGTIVPAALQHNAELAARGLSTHVLVRIEPERDAELRRDMPLVACAACGALGAARASSFALPCGRASAKGLLAVARLEKRLAPAISGKVAVAINPLRSEG